MKIDSSSSSSFAAEESSDGGFRDICMKMRRREWYLWSWPPAERVSWTSWTVLLICPHLASCRLPEFAAPLLPSASPLEDRRNSSVSKTNPVIFHCFLQRWSTDVITARRPYLTFMNSNLRNKVPCTISCFIAASCTEAWWGKVHSLHVFVVVLRVEL